MPLGPPRLVSACAEDRHQALPNPQGRWRKPFWVCGDGEDRVKASSTPGGSPAKREGTPADPAPCNQPELSLAAPPGTEFVAGAWLISGCNIASEGSFYGVCTKLASCPPTGPGPPAAGKRDRGPRLVGGIAPMPLWSGTITYLDHDGASVWLYLSIWWLMSGAEVVAWDVAERERRQ